MSPLLSSAAAILLAVGGSCLLTSSSTAGGTAGERPFGDRPRVSLVPSMTIRAADAEQSARVYDALARFRFAGLQLPDLEIAFHDDDASCDGHDGMFRPHDVPWRIDVCRDLAFVVPHELAHAWAAANLDDDDRARYIDARGLTNWSDSRVPWEERGTEDAAFMIQQNLRAIDLDVSSAAWRERIRAYELLTGMTSPAGRMLCPV
jgi:hypothetical protein